jgi:hypothetical protein
VKAALLGALLAAGGIAALIIAADHHPHFVSAYLLNGGWGVGGTVGWSSTKYDLVRIGGWTAIVFGVVIVAVALVREIRHS